jgi:DNA-binding NtrC family response regulator
LSGRLDHILIIEDDPGVRFFLEEALKGEGYGVKSFESYEAALPAVMDTVDLVILDISLPGIDGLAAMDDLKRRSSAPILIITAYGTKKNALEAIKKGAADFFVKPIPLDELKIITKRLLGRQRLQQESETLREEELSTHVFHGVVGQSEQMKEIFGHVMKIADRDITVLITGETGVGKEAVATLIHRLSGRKGAFVAVNCASIPDSLLESELFGYQKGAFTGALQEKQGKFEAAHLGTLLLDEIGEMSPNLQAKLLRVIETTEIERLGEVKKRKIDVKILATTNKILEREMKEGRFRDDLFFRISQMHISIPPLRERPEDVEVLIEHLLNKVSRQTGSLLEIDTDARGVLMSYTWPGNVRELINVIKRASIMCDQGIIRIDDLPLHLRGDHELTGGQFTDKSLEEAISDLEKEMIVEALNKTKGLQSRAAKALGISERSMWYRIKKYGIEVKGD